MYTQTAPCRHPKTGQSGPSAAPSSGAPLSISDRIDAREALWNAIRGKRLSEIVFRRNHVMGSITVDFFAPQFHLAIGVNEPGVSSKHWFYAKQDAQLRHMGFRVLRFTAEEIEREMPMLLDSIVEVASQIARRQRKI